MKRLTLFALRFTNMITRSGSMIVFMVVTVAAALEAPVYADSSAVPPEFVDLKDVNPSIQIEMRYASDWNFTGQIVPGYKSNHCLLVKEAAEALSKAQARLQKAGYSLLVFDCYRPQRAVTSFVTWTKNRDDQKMKAYFYPDEPKAKLVARGYIDSFSGHSRGATVDLTIVKISALREGGSFHEEKADCRKPANIEATGQLDMGTTYDCFSALATTANSEISKEAKTNRRLLKDVMEKSGFKNFEKEWWHYTLRNEPFKDRAFDFEVDQLPKASKDSKSSNPGDT